REREKGGVGAIEMEPPPGEAKAGKEEADRHDRPEPGRTGANRQTMNAHRLDAGRGDRDQSSSQELLSDERCQAVIQRRIEVRNPIDRRSPVKWPPLSDPLAMIEDPDRAPLPRIR